MIKNSKSIVMNGVSLLTRLTSSICFGEEKDEGLILVSSRRVNDFEGGLFFFGDVAVGIPIKAAPKSSSEIIKINLMLDKLYEYMTGNS